MAPADHKGQDYQADAKVSAFKKRQGDHVHHQPLSVRAAKRQRMAARLHGNLKPMRFVSLHHHSTYSFLDGFQLPEAHVRRATEINMGALAMTEHGNVFSHVKLEKAATEQGVKPIFGCEFYMGWSDPARRTQMKNHLTVLAKNDTGYRNLLALVTRSWAEGFHYEPTVDPNWLVEMQEGLIVLSGCQGSALFTALVGGKHVPEEDASYKRGLRVARWFSDRLDDYYIEVQAFPELDKTRAANPMLARIAASIGRPLVATMDIHYTAPEEVEIQKILHNVRPGNKRTLEDQVRDWGYEVPLCPPPTDKAVFRRLVGTGLTASQASEAIASTSEIADEINVTLPRQPRVQFPTDDPHATWLRLLREGWHYRGFGQLPPAEAERYRKQLAHERKLIEEKDFVGYFLIVADAVRWCKDQQIPVGPARGSAAGSLVAYILRITEVNPLLFPLLQFERFIDPTREDMPDIDLDFAPSGLPRLRKYMEEKYGEGHVGTVGTFGMFRSKAALDAVAKVYRVPKFEVEKVKDLLLTRSKGDLRASATVQDTFEQFDAAQDVVERYPDLHYAEDLEGNAQNFGIHAAGLVVANAPIDQLTPILERWVENKSSGIKELRQVLGVDKYDAERQGMEKLDFLSLSTMEHIAEVLRIVDRPLEDLYDIALDDEATIEGFQDNDVVGVFQYDGRTTKFVNGLLKPDDFDEVAVGVALSRPGPMLNGAAQAYIAVKNGADIVHLHPAFEEIAKLTRGQIIFQEQILAIVRDIGNFDWTHRAEIRRIMSKKMGEAEFNRQWLRFYGGAKELHGMDEETARAIWNICISAGSYAFNAAHSYSYGMLAFWTMFLKRNCWGEGPAPFYAAGLAKLPEKKEKGGMEVRHSALRQDADKHGVELRPPGARAGATWSKVGPMAIQAGWEQVPGIGPKTARILADYDGDDITEIVGIGPRKVEQLNEFRNAEDPFGVRRVSSALSAAKEAAAEAGLPVPTHTCAEALAMAGGTTAVVCVMPTHRNLRELFEVHRARFGEELDPATVKDKVNTEWVLMPCRDDDESIQLIFGRKRYNQFRRAIWGIKLNHDVVLAKVFKMKDSGNDARGWGGGGGIFHVNEMWVIDPEEE